MDLKSAPAPPVWTRQAGETAKAFCAFRCYRDLDPWLRSVREAYKQWRAAKGSYWDRPRPPKEWAAWSGRYNWVERAQAYDNYLDELRRSARESVIWRHAAALAVHQIEVFTDTEFREVLAAGESEAQV